MPLVVLGANHRTASIEVRERFALGSSQTPALVAELLAEGAAAEAVVLSTCNRTEIYLHDPANQGGVELARKLLARHAGQSVREISRFLYVHHDRRAAEHLFRVAAGLDSMILGEPQIQGQVREAYGAAREAADPIGPTVGTVLNRLFQNALSAGGRVRSETEIGIGAASVPSAAVELTKKIFGSLRGRRALILGAGEMSEITLECLRTEGVHSVIVANRTYERACELARRCNGQTIPWAEFSGALRNIDIVICSTAAPHPVLTRRRFFDALPDGPPRPLCIIDIAIPRDADPTLGDEPNVFLYNVDDLRQIVDDSLDRRRAQLPSAEEIIAEAVEDFWTWYASLAVVPTIRDLRSRTESVRQAETDRLLRRLSHLAPEDQQAIDALTRALLNKLLHTPTVRLREAAGNGRGTAVLDTVRYLFQLDGAEGEIRSDATPGAPHGISHFPED